MGAVSINAANAEEKSVGPGMRATYICSAGSTFTLPEASASRRYCASSAAWCSRSRMACADRFWHAQEMLVTYYQQRHGEGREMGHLVGVRAQFSQRARREFIKFWP